MGDLKRLVQKSIDVSRGKTDRGKLAARVAAGEQERKDKMFAAGRMPDEEELRRNQRRLAAKRRGSRADTVLTETLG